MSIKKKKTLTILVELFLFFKRLMILLMNMRNALSLTCNYTLRNYNHYLITISIFFLFLSSVNSQIFTWNIWKLALLSVMCLYQFLNTDTAQSAVTVKIHRLNLCQTVRPPTQRISWIWWGSCNAGALGNAQYPYIAVTTRSTLK